MARLLRLFSFGCFCFFGLVLTSGAGCGSSPSSGFDSNGSGSDDASTAFVTDDSGSSTSGDDGPSIGDPFGGDSAAPQACSGGGLGCYVPQGCTTTVSGTVFDPAGTTPLYNVAVFVPNDPAGTVPAITLGTKTCNTCDVSIGNYIAVTTTDSKGHFSLSGVPATSRVPIVVQTGKWRREIFLPSVTACKDNPQANGTLRLPRGRKDGVVADLPQMALVTGGADDLGCFMRSMGIDASEFSKPHAGGRLDIYTGAGGGNLFGIQIGGAPGLTGGGAGDCSGASCPLWSAKSSLESYDIVILACEGTETLTNKPNAGLTALHDWLGEGGKVFATHFHYVWFKDSPQTDFQNVATWLGVSSGSGKGNYTIDTSFPKGQKFDEWLQNVGAANGTSIGLNGVATSVSSVAPSTTRWIYEGPAASPGNTKYLSFLTPIGGVPGSAPTAGGDGGTDAGSSETNTPQYCGKAVFSDLHAGGSPSGDVPGSCNNLTLTAQEKALEFLFFDLSACVAPDTLPPPPPPQSVQ
jgi:hypothetical protein